MKKIFVWAVILAAFLVACSGNGEVADVADEVMNFAEVIEVPEVDAVSNIELQTAANVGTAYLFGEIHGNELYLNVQLSLWRDFYNEGMRHMFVELPFFGAEWLNLWMQADDDDILDNFFASFRGTALDNPYSRNFLLAIKEEFPETIFHGTDIGHGYSTLGVAFLEYLRENGLAGSEQYELTLENIEQGRKFYGELNMSHEFRVESMLQNFIRAFEELGESIMSGFYGGAHVMFGYYHPNWGGGPTLATRLREIYGDNIVAVLINDILEGIIEFPTKIMTINGREYVATFLGSSDMRSFSTVFVYRQFWRIEGAYEDFAENPLNGNVLPFDNFPVPVEVGQVFAILYTRVDGTTEWHHMRSSGRIWQGRPITEQFLIE
ncbi:MAG: hypothetical protein FWG65_02535 [Turicibacter sp.]|nr:hypothetical protein [Turicibacter sp.]